MTGRLDEIYIYPLKGARGIRVESALIESRGLVNDRIFMIVQELDAPSKRYVALTQRNLSIREQGRLSLLPLIVPQLSSHNLILSWDSSPDSISISTTTDSPSLAVYLGSDMVDVYDLGDQPAVWLSEHLRLKVRLVRMPKEYIRKASERYIKNDNHLFLQDNYPIHWVTRESLAELSALACMPIPSSLFRPNFVVSGFRPGEEHSIKGGTVSNISFIQPRPCSRCSVVLVNQTTGLRQGPEPLATLAKYRQWHDRNGQQKVIFGAYMLPSNEGTVTEGDIVRARTIS